MTIDDDLARRSTAWAAEADRDPVRPIVERNETFDTSTSYFGLGRYERLDTTMCG